MVSDKEIKKQFKKTASQHPEKYYAVSVLKEQGFSRRQCACGTWFWSVTGQKHCGDPVCAGGFGFFGTSPAKKKMDYLQAWQEFSNLFKKLGYTPIDRYPVVARWRDDTDFVQASIYDFQPYVVSGEVKPPAKKLVVPQFCLRFNDIDNVGITGAHYTGFVMIGQHAFVTEQEWDQAQYFQDIHAWLTQGLGLPNNEITFHEDAWAGGGNFGPCMEFFSRGLELGNQVYMLFENTPSGSKPLNLRVLDMGMGHERNAWFTQGTATSYETTFPTVCSKLFHATGIDTTKKDKDFIQRFLPYSSYLNVDEVEDINKTWNFVANKLDVATAELKKKILPLAALFSVGEHSRSLLFALNDGALPSNTAGGYNLRVILRRALSFIDANGWNLDLPTVCEWHAVYLKPLFPELGENLENVRTILDVEKNRYETTKQKTRSLVLGFIEKKEALTTDKLVELYDSNGIAPALVREEAAQVGISVPVPDNFYALVAERHAQLEQEHATIKKEQLPLNDLPDTKALYFSDWRKVTAQGKVLRIINTAVVLDQTVFYPTSGGQLHDTGTVGGHRVIDVFKQGGKIVHVLDHLPTHFVEGETIECVVDRERRTQLAQHHTATHLVSAAARRILGPHINQAGSKKTTEKAQIDITHYESLTGEQLKKIEAEANRLVQEHLPVRLGFLPRDEAEKKFGMTIYQGGAVPGMELRIVEIPEVDVECCGGTHLTNTGDIGQIKMLGATKIKDGVVRLLYTAGIAAQQEQQQEKNIVRATARLLQCEVSQVPGRAQELFTKWKSAVKKKKSIDKELVSSSHFSGTEREILNQLCIIYKTQPEHVIKTTERFLQELREA